MFNYNVANPVNIHYRKYQNNDTVKSAGEETGKQALQNAGEEGQNKRFPNGNKVAIDYTKNKINISQVLQDFRSTISAINSPDDVKEEVEIYLGLVGKESEKNEPSREIVLSNLKNAARVTDKYIQESLKKPSRVVQDWVDALFLQQINLKANPDEINEEFRVKIPSKNQNTETPAVQEGYKDPYIAPASASIKPLEKDTAEIGKEKIANNEKPIYTVNQSYIEKETPVVQTFEPIYKTEEKKEERVQKEEKADLYALKTENEELAKEALLKGKISFQNGDNMYETLKKFDEALELTEGSQNKNLKSAIYFERGKIFDSYDYAELALIDYNKATKCEDNNLKAQAHIKMGNIYDDYVMFDPAMDQYSLAIEASEEAENLYGKTRALRYMASMFTKLYDNENTESFTELAMESAKETENPKTIAKTYLEAADNYKYIGLDSKALNVYSRLAQEEKVKDDFETLAKNYMEASMLMDKKGNKQKSYALMVKAKEYQRLARMQKSELGAA